MGADGSYRIDMDDVAFNWNPRREADDPSYEFFSGHDWAVSRMYRDTAPYLRVVGDEETIQRDIDRVLVLRILDGTFPQETQDIKTDRW